MRATTQPGSKAIREFRGSTETVPTCKNAKTIALHRPARYDLFIWLITLGRERAYREKLVNLAQLEAGESVLDIGCGMGSPAIAPKRRVGKSGTVIGFDASPQILGRARKKAKKAGVTIEFGNEIAEALPFPDAQFDAVLSTVMLHHLPGEARKQCAPDIRRVLKPGGRMLAVDFGERLRAGEV